MSSKKKKIRSDLPEKLKKKKIKNPIDKTILWYYINVRRVLALEVVEC